MVVNGNFFGVSVFGTVTPTHIAKATAIFATVEQLRKQLADLFDENVANAIIAKMGVAVQGEITDGELPQSTETTLRMLADMGIIGKANG